MPSPSIPQFRRRSDSAEVEHLRAEMNNSAFRHEEAIRATKRAREVESAAKWEWIRAVSAYVRAAHPVSKEST